MSVAAAFSCQRCVDSDISRSQVGGQTLLPFRQEMETLILVALRDCFAVFEDDVITVDITAAAPITRRSAVDRLFQTSDVVGTCSRGC